MNFSLNFEPRDFLTGLDIIQRDMNKIARKMMSRVFASIKKLATEKMKGEILNKQSGNLIKSLKYAVKNDFKGYIVARSPYAVNHEFGGTILPKNGEYLHFKIGDSWVKTKQVVLPQRRFLGPTFYDHFQTNKAQRLMEEALEKALKQIMEKNSV